MKIAITGTSGFLGQGAARTCRLDYWFFTRAIPDGQPIDVFNPGLMQRNFTHIDDVAEGTVRVLDRIPQPSPDDISTNASDSGSSCAP